MSELKRATFGNVKLNILTRSSFFDRLLLSIPIFRHEIAKNILIGRAWSLAMKSTHALDTFDIVDTEAVHGSCYQCIMLDLEGTNMQDKSYFEQNVLR